MGNLKIEYLQISDLIPYANNPRINDGAVDAVATSIKEFGFKNPIVIDSRNVIIAGHTRLKAAEKLGLKTVPIIRADDLTEQQARAFRLADNKTAELAEWDFDSLEQELDELSQDFDMTDFGFELLDFDDDETEIMEDKVPEEVKTRCKVGDIYQLGNHRLICGDSTDITVIDRLMDGVKADMVFTDPPYNMSDNLSGFISDEMKSKLDNIVDFDPNTVVDALFAINTNNYFIFTSKELIPKYFKIFEEWGFNILVWCKDNPTPMTNNTFLPDVEYLLYFYKNGRVWNNGLDVSVYKKYYNSNKMEGRKEAGNVHPTIKPIKIIADKVQICSNKNGIVVDIFGGSGSTLIACEQLNRKCYMVELDPHYVDVIIQRFETLTGKKAEKIDG
jgi:site-specific DNA-methyltransferase (adenine-specific)